MEDEESKVLSFILSLLCFYCSLFIDGSVKIIPNPDDGNSKEDVILPVPLVQRNAILGFPSMVRDEVI